MTDDVEVVVVAADHIEELLSPAEREGIRIIDSLPDESRHALLAWLDTHHA